MHQACSLCEELMTEQNGQQFLVEVPQIGKNLIFKICPSCQSKARHCTLHVCLSCKATTWVQTNEFTPAGVRYHVKFQCDNCMTKMLREAFAYEARGVIS